MDIVDRLLSRIKVNANGCFEWQGARCVGYGRLRMGKDIVGAHRVSYETFRGPIPAGLFVCHHCDNPACINPAHLFLGTNSDNMQDAIRKGRIVRKPARPAPARKNPKLTAAQVIAIKEGWRSGRRQRDMAPEYGVTPGNISMICRGATWKHVSVDRIPSTSETRA